MLSEVVVNPKRAANALSWAVAEMERRYDLLAEVGMRDITGYNAAFDRGEFSAGALDPGAVPAKVSLDAGAGDDEYGLDEYDEDDGVERDGPDDDGDELDDGALALVGDG